MPYIKKADRLRLQDGGFSLPDFMNEPVGSLTYVLYQAALSYLQRNSDSYQTRAEILGALESAKLEFYRRDVAPYEDIKMRENGDVW
jgi:hypothetical protein